ncbi:MAG: RNA methyltransferase, partial [Deltaproteobacteria bacterium]|nr:RNA methyltransferase [Deltaproteobacteria bacterium]
MEITLKKDNIAIILVNPQIPENIGAAARAMNNMGLSRLILVAPKNPDRDRMLLSGTIHTREIIDKIEICNNLEEAVGKFEYIAGTTARLGTMRPAMTSPGSLAERLIEVSQNNEIAILFGPEDKGLSNEHLQYCHTITTIPTSEFSSLNLAQAVLIICYEIFRAGMKETQATPPRLANSFELEGMYSHLREILLKIGFLNPQNPDLWMLFVRRFFSRLPMRAREVGLIRGICRQIDWYTGKRLED